LLPNTRNNEQKSFIEQNVIQGVAFDGAATGVELVATVLEMAVVPWVIGL